nr:putative ribonuclease H-like domain-containing protein [Tanacetum cinerariifolium]
MQDKLLQFKIQKVWILVDLLFGKKAIGTKWVYKNKKDKRGVVVRNKARLVAQGHKQEEWIDYDEVFAHVARIEAIMIFLAFASYMGLIVYQMDAKSAFLYGKIDKEVYVSQPPGFIDPKFPNKDKYVAKILKKFDFLSVKTASTPIETKKPLVKDEEVVDVDVHLYRSMIGSLMYLTAFRPDIIIVMLLTLGKKMQFGLVLGALYVSMANLEFVAQHNMVACLEKAEGNSEFHKIVDFLTSSTIQHALIVSPTIYTSYIEQFWNTATSQTLNDEKNLDNLKKKFLMYLIFLMVFLNNQIELDKPFNDVYIAPAHTLKVFLNMSRKGLKFSGKITPLFPNMLIQAEGEGSGAPTELQLIPSRTHHSTGVQPPVTESSSIHDTTQDSRDSLDGTNKSEEEQIRSPHDSPLLGGHTSDRAKGCSSCRDHCIKTRIKKLEKKWGEKDKPTLDDSTLDDLDANHGMDTEEPMNQGRLSEETEELVSTARLEDSIVRPDVGTADLIAPPPPTTTTSIFNDEDITMAQPLIKMKEEKAKEKWVSIKDIEDTSRPMTKSDLDAAQIAKDVEIVRLVYEEELAKLEREKEKRQREEEASKAAIAEMYNEVQAGIEVDALFAANLQQEEREEYTIEKSKVLS